MSLTTEPRPGVDPLATYRAAQSSTQSGTAFIAGRAQQSARTPSTARQIVVDFLTKRLAANNTRITWLLEGTPEALTAWVNAENALQDDA